MENFKKRRIEKSLEILSEQKKEKQKKDVHNCIMYFIRRMEVQNVA